MKSFLLSVCLLATSASLSAQTTITEWNFNSFTGGSAAAVTPSTGNGSVALVGGTTTPATTASGTGSSDTSSTNIAFQTSTYAAAGTENKQRGVEFTVSTLGYKDIVFKFDQRLSNSTANTWVVQYAVNGSGFTDAQTFTFTPAATGTGDTWYLNRSVNFSTIPNVINQNEVKFRVVAAFDPTTGDYLAARSTSTYSTTGTSRFDMVNVSGTPLALGTQENTAAKTILVFPNPASNEIRATKSLHGTILTSEGRVVGQINGVSADISNLNSGVYTISSKEGTYRFIKK